MMLAVREFAQRLLNLRHGIRRRIVVFLDVILLWLATYLAFVAVGITANEIPVANVAFAVVIYIIVTQVLFSVFRVYRAIIRHLDITALAMAMFVLLITSGLLTGLLLAFTGVLTSPVLFFLIHSYLAIICLAGYRLILFFAFGRNNGQSTSFPVIGIFGSDQRAQQFAAAQRVNKRYDPKFILTDDQSFAGGMINGVRVYHVDQLDWAITRFLPAFVVFCCDEEEFRANSHIVGRLLDNDIPVRLNSASSEDIREGGALLSARRVEIEDLIGRSPNPADSALLDKAVGGRRVLVTGGGGSIGGALCEKIIDLEPASLVVLDHDEKALAESRRKHTAVPVPVRHELVNVCDEKAMDSVFDTGRFDIVFHAAAYKHVDIGEEAASAFAANNVLGTKTAIECAIRYKVSDFVLISTDKAVDPSSVMGASKRWCEEMIRCTAPDAEGRYISVRFGNVIESSGSVIPLFKRQIADGGPVTITDERMERYFMALEEAVELILQSVSLAKGGEVFVLKMGEPIRILEVARTLIKLAGHTIRRNPESVEGIEIVERGLRPGEKLNERLFDGEETIVPSRHDSILVSTNKSLPKQEIIQTVNKLSQALDMGDPDRVRSILLSGLKRRDGPAVPDAANGPASLPG